MAVGPGIPVDVAAKIAERFGKQVVLIVAYDATHGSTHIVTYGVSSEQKEVAALAGDLTAQQLGMAMDKITKFEDFRTVDQAKRCEQIERLRKVCRRAYNEFATLFDLRSLQEDHAIRLLCDDLKREAEAKG